MTIQKFKKYGALVIGILTLTSPILIWVGSIQFSQANDGRRLDNHWIKIKETDEDVEAIKINVEGRLSTIEGQNKLILEDLKFIKSRL